MCSQEPYTSAKYNLMYYSGAKRNSIGVRRKFGDKKQIFQFGGSNCVMERGQLWGFGEDCLRKLDAGVAEEDVKVWVKEAISA